MITKVFAVYDSKAEAFMAPFTFQTKGQAVRGFSDVASDPKTMIGKHPLDFALFELGEFDDSKGVYTNLKAPVNMGLATEFVKTLDNRDLFSAPEVKDAR